jgi:hypothetical protein
LVVGGGALLWRHPSGCRLFVKIAPIGCLTGVELAQVYLNLRKSGNGQVGRGLCWSLVNGIQADFNKIQQGY